MDSFLTAQSIKVKDEEPLLFEFKKGIPQRFWMHHSNNGVRDI